MEDKSKKLDNFKKISLIIGQVFLLLLVAYLVFYFVFDKLAPNSTAKRQGYKTYNVLTGSMTPVINEGDLIVVVRKNFNKLEEGDIVTFIDPYDNVVTHNFVRYENATFNDKDGNTVTVKVIRTRAESDKDGNPNTFLDPWNITEDKFIGKYSFRIPKMGKFVTFLQSWAGIAFIFFIVGFVYVIIYLVEFIKKERQKQLELESKTGDNKEVIEQEE